MGYLNFMMPNRITNPDTHICPKCGETMIWEDDDSEEVLICLNCGREEVSDAYIEDMNEYDNLYKEDDDIPEGCVACGGPYPQCMTACPLFDD